MPDRPWTMESQKSSKPIPLGARTPIPVITTLLFSITSTPCPWNRFELIF